MTLSQFETRLKAANPKLRIKRYGVGKAGVHFENAFVCRAPQGEITAYTVVKEKIGYNGDYMSARNPRGAYKYDFIERRGRHAIARILLGKKLIKHSDIGRISQ